MCYVIESQSRNLLRWNWIDVYKTHVLFIHNHYNNTVDSEMDFYCVNKCTLSVLIVELWVSSRWSNFYWYLKISKDCSISLRKSIPFNSTDSHQQKCNPIEQVQFYICLYCLKRKNKCCCVTGDSFNITNCENTCILNC